MGLEGHWCTSHNTVEGRIQRVDVMASCVRCDSEVPAGSRWCRICHVNVVRPEVGQLASPGKRLAAYVLDLVIPLAGLFVMIPLVAGGAGVAGVAAGFGEEAVGAAAVVVLFALLGVYLVRALVLFARGTTPGKWVLRMYVFKESGQRAGFFTMLFREWIGKWISAVVLYLGFLWILFDPDRQGWHDKLASTYVAISPRGDQHQVARSLVPPSTARSGDRPQAHTGHGVRTSAELSDQRPVASTTGTQADSSNAAKEPEEAANSLRPGDPAAARTPARQDVSTGGDAAQSSAPRFCRFCGTNLQDAARFCGGCGQAVMPARVTETAQLQPDGERSGRGRMFAVAGVATAVLTLAIGSIWMLTQGTEPAAEPAASPPDTPPPTITEQDSSPPTTAPEDNSLARDGGGDVSDAFEGTGLLAELQEAGSVTVGVANEVPFGYVGDDGEVTGIAPDVARVVLAELGIDEMDAQVVEFGELIGGLQAGQFNMITAGMYITASRAEQIYFSDPDYCISESLAVEEGNPHGIVNYQSLVDNPDVIVAVASGTVEVAYLEDAGVPDVQVQVYGDIDGMYRALEAGEVDVVTGTAATVETQVAAREGMEAVPGFFPVDAEGNEVFPCGGHGFADEDFRDAFNEVLNQFREDGTTMEIITAYRGFSEDDVALANRLSLEDFLR